MDAAGQAIGYAVNSAEQMAGEQIRDVVVNLAGGHPASQIVGVEMSITGHDVGEVDLKRALKAHNNAAVSPDREVIHAIPVGYSIDGSRGIRDPRGMFGDRLGVAIHRSQEHTSE